MSPRMICPRCGLGEVADSTSTCPRCGFAAPGHQPTSDPLSSVVLESVRQELGSDYQIEGTLGRGGMSIVFLTREMELNRLVALKVLPLQLTMGPDAPERFKREAKLSASLEHPNIVPIHRVGTAQTFLWYTMKFVKGRSLSDILTETGPMDVEQCLGIIGQVATALEYAHRRGIVHRDIKPANILVDQTGWTTVCDFGIARAFGALPLTQSGSTLGTPEYMSPEQCYGRTLDGRSDLYSLAILTYECLAGTPPFTADSLGEIVRKHCIEPPPRITDERPEVGDRVADAIIRGMAKDPDARYRTVVELVEALGQPSGRTTPTFTAAPDTQATIVTAATQRVDARPWHVRRGWIVTAAAVLLFAGLVWVTGPRFAPSEPIEELAGVPGGEAGGVGGTEGAGGAGNVGPVTAPVKPGQLSINSTPWGVLYVDDDSVGTTPLMGLELAPGSHSIRIVQQGFSPYQRVVQITTGEELRLTDIALRRDTRP